MKAVSALSAVGPSVPTAAPANSSRTTAEIITPSHVQPMFTSVYVDSAGDAVSPRHAAPAAHGGPLGSPHHPSPRFGGSWGHGNGGTGGFSGAAFRSQSTPDAHVNGGSGGGWERNGDAVSSPTCQRYGCWLSHGRRGNYSCDPGGQCDGNTH